MTFSSRVFITFTAILRALLIQVFVAYSILAVLASFIEHLETLVLKKLAKSQYADVGRRKVYGLINGIHSIL